MTKKKMIGDVSSKLLGMLGDLMVKLKNGAITLREFELFLNRMNPFVTPDDIRSEWQEFYSRVFGMEVDFSEVKTPDEKSGFDRVLFIPQGLTISQAFVACRKQFKTRPFADNLDIEVADNLDIDIIVEDDLDSDALTHDRSPKNCAYAIRLRDRREADEELKYLSADELTKHRIEGITLLERLVLELKYFDETSEHLDMRNVTICSGSRDSIGHVPHVGWQQCGLSFDWLHSDGSDFAMRSRAVIS